MAGQISLRVAEILEKGEDCVGISKTEALELLRLPLQSKETYALMAIANQVSRERFKGKGENHFHIGINVEPCRFNCRFCSLTHQAGIFKERIEFSEHQILHWAKNAESNSADALNIMTTGTYSFERLLEIGKMLKKEISTPLVANTRDFDHQEAERLLDAGFVGAYHAVRLGEGKDTPFKVKKRIQTIKVMRDVGLHWMNCVEPVGPEHGHEEIVDLMFLARQYNALYSGIMRRINFPGSPLEKHGMISEFEMARMVAVSRLVMGDIPKAHCTHEPHSLSLISGVNLFFPEVGASPRDNKADTETGRGTGIRACRRMQMETGWNPDLPSNCFNGDEYTNKKAISSR